MHPVVRAILQSGDGRTYYYNEGDECTAITGGWGNGLTAASGATTRTKQTDHLYLSLVSPTSAQISAFATNNVIDFTSQSRFYMECDVIKTGSGTYDSAGYRLGTNKMDNLYEGGFKSITQNATREIFELDITNSNGSYYLKAIVSAEASKTTTLKVYKMWSE
jgi:hypothetical protein